MTLFGTIEIFYSPAATGLEPSETLAGGNDEHRALPSDCAKRTSNSLNFRSDTHDLRRPINP